MAEIKPSTGRCAPGNAYLPHASGGVGMPGGISPYREGGSAGWPTVDVDLTGYGPTDDISTVLNNYLYVYKNTGTRIKIPAGDWTVNGGLGIEPTGPAAYGGSFVLCGAGAEVTRLHKRNNTGFISLGAGNTYGEATPNGPGASGAVTATTLTAGTSAVAISASDRATYNIEAYRLIKFYWSDLQDNSQIATGIAPWFQTKNAVSGNNPYTYRYIALVTDVTGDVVTFSPPIPHVPGGTGLTCKIYGGFQTWASHSIGLEDFSLVVENTATSIFSLISFSECWYSWMFNVKVSVNSAVNYPMLMNNCVNFEIRGCDFRGVPGLGSNHALILMASSTSCLVEDNIFADGSPCLEINTSNANNFHANFVNGEFNINHGPGNFGNLYIRNVTAFFKDDGYFGPSQADLFVGNWAYQFGGMALRRFTFNSGWYGNVLGSTTDLSYNNFIAGLGIPYSGGVDAFYDTKTHSSILTGVFPADWPFPTQYLRVTALEDSNTLATFTRQGTMFFSGYGNNFDAYLDGLGAMGEGNVLSETQIKWRRQDNGTFPAVNTDVALVAPSPTGYQEHNDDVYESADIRANFLLNINWSNFPAQSIGTDTIWEPMGITSAPAGDGVDEIDWNGCPWYTNGDQQYGFINRSATTSVAVTDIPAGLAYTNDDFTRYNVTSGIVATPTFSPGAGSYVGTQTVTISCSTVGATIRYTTDGSTPTSSSGTIYSSPVNIASTTTLKAIAYDGVLTDSAVRTGTYTITPETSIGSLVITGALTANSVTLGD